MKVCVISPGVVHAVPRTVAIAEQFDEVHFIDISRKADSAILEAKDIVYHGPESAEQSIISIGQLKRLLNDINPDVIVCHYALGDHFFTAITFGKCPVAAIAMGNDVLYDEGDCFVPYLGRLLTRMALRRARFIAAKSRFLANRIKSYGVTSAIAVNYWGADLNQYYPGNKVEARGALGWKASGPIVLSPRAIEPRLNIHLIIEAFQKVLSAYPDASLVILGRSDPEYKRKIEENILWLNLGDKVRVVDEVGQDVLPLCFQASDVLVSMACCEGFPNTLLEAMGCKIPIVVGRIPQIEELLENDKNAVICEKNPGEIAGAILGVLSAQEKSQRLSNEGYNTVMQYANIKQNGRAFSNNLKQLLPGYKRPLWVQTLIFSLVFFMYRIQRRILRREQGTNV